MDQKEREARRDRKGELEQSLGISFYKLMEEHPLYDGRVEGKLPVLLIGTGDCLEFLLDKILANGQLLDTELQVTILTDDPQRDRSRLTEYAPELWRFVELGCAGKEPEEKPAWAQVSYVHDPLTPKSLKTVPEQYADWRCILVSTGSHERNQRIAGLFPVSRERVVAWVAADTTPEEERKNKDGVVQEREMLCVRGEQTKELCCGRKDDFLKKIEPIAYNLHYAYAKGINPHAGNEWIREDFDDPYNYNSNIECAIHIRSKLRCCGIDDPYDKFAADQFARRLEGKDGEALLNQLAQLEHRRWCISKLLQGFRLQKDVSKIYSAPRVTTHSKDDLWHVCLVPYQYTKDKRRITEADWELETPEQIEQIKELDELDKQTLRIHLACRTIKENNRQDCFDAAERIAELAKEQVFEGMGLQADAEQIRSALEKMYQDSASALFVFNQCTDRISRAMKQLPEKDPNAEKMRGALKELKDRAGALIEYITRKDYKQPNLTLVQQIPFALSKWENAALVKIMAEDVSACVAAAWHMEPGRVVFVDFADSYAELSRIQRRARRIDRFLFNSCNQIRTTYHVFLSGALRELSEEARELLDGWGCTIHKVESGEPHSIRPAFAMLMEEIKPDYIDLTGGKTELICLAEGYAQNSTAGAFSIRDDRICNFYGAKRMEYRNLHRGLTVQEMFDQSDALRIKRDDQDLSGEIMEKYEKFWNVAYGYSEYWYGFCVHYFAKAYKAMLEDPDADKQDALVLHERYFQKQKEALEKEAAAKKKLKDQKKAQEAIEANDKILAELVKAGVIARDEAGNYQFGSEDILSALRNSGKVLEYYIYCAARNQGFQDVAMSWMFSHSEAKDAAKNEVDVICTTEDQKSLFISAKFVGMNTIESGNFLNYVCYEVFSVASQFGSKEESKRIMILAAPNVPQFEENTRELSQYVKRALSRKVYLLGDECFRDGRLGQVLENIAAGVEKWYEVKEPAQV